MGLPLNRNGVGQITMFIAVAEGGGDCFNRELMDRSEGCTGEWDILRLVGDSQCIPPMGLDPVGGDTDLGECLLTSGGDWEAVF